MKILIVNAFDETGGAARAAYRLHKALLNEEIESRMLVQSKSGDNSTVFGPTAGYRSGIAKLRPALDKIFTNRYKNKSRTLFSPSWLPFSNIVDKINEINPDIVHLHWIANGMMRIEDIARIKAPIVWSLHDMWAFTGGCHYDENCARYMQNCGYCKVLASNKSNDLSAKVHRRKQKVFASIDLTIIGLSRWLANAARNSSLFAKKTVLHLPNPIDTNIFAPIDKQLARALFNLPDRKKLILFGAINATGDPRKGFEELSNSLEEMENGDVELVVFGSNKPSQLQQFKQHTHYVGHLFDDISLRILYSAADVMVVPSLQEAFGQTASEAMACGTPVVAFNIGGLPDIVEHKKTGYLATAFDAVELARGIQWVISQAKHRNLGTKAREKAVTAFSYPVVAKQYIEIYKKVLRE